MGEFTQQKQAAAGLKYWLLAFILAAAVNAHAADMPDELSAANILGFARACESEGDYYRAYTELGRLQAYYPTFADRQTILVSQNYYLFKGGRFAALAAAPAASAETGIFAADSLFALRDYTGLNRLLAAPEFAQNTEMIFKRKFLANLGMQNYDGLANLETLYAGDYSGYRELLSYAKQRRSEEKSPALAVALGIFPGGGYMYAGKGYTGITALVIISLSGALTWAAYGSGNKMIAIFIGAAGTFLYGGSILGGYMETVKRNKAIENDLMENCGERLRLSQDLEALHKEQGIGKLK